jgi:hypothetical protein
MTCHDARDQFSALVDDALTRGERAALDAHLATCADCRRELRRFRDTVALVRSVVPARAPVGFVDRVLEAARPVPWYRKLVRGLFLPWPVKLPMEAAAIVLVAVGVALVYRGAPEPPRATFYDQGVREREAPPAQTPPPQRETDARRETHDAREVTQAKDQVRGLFTTRDDKEAPEPMKAPASPPPVATTPAAPSPAAPPPALAPPAAGQQLVLSQAPEPQQPAERREQQTAQAPAKLEAPSATSERERAAVAQSRATPTAPLPRADTSRAKASPPSVTGSLAFVPPAVSGRLAVSDRDVALRGIAELAKRLGAVETHRADTAEGQILELTVPREAYPEFIRELARLGRWQPSTEPAELPAQVRVVLQISR